jgi:hypothetical protein
MKMDINDNVHIRETGIDEHGTYYYKVELSMRSSRRARWFAADVMLSSPTFIRWLQQSGLSVGKYQIGWIREEVARAPFPTKTIVHKTGWVEVGSKYNYVTPVGVIGPHRESVVLLGDEPTQLEGWRVRGYQMEWWRELRDFADGNPLIVAAYLAAFAAPFLRLFDARPFTAYIVGESSSGKTSLASAVAAPYGGGSSVLGAVSSANISIEAINRMLAERNDAALFLDDPQQTHGNERKAAETLLLWIFRVSAGATRKVYGSNEDVSTFRTVMVVTGNRDLRSLKTLVGNSVDHHAHDARVIELRADRPYGIFDRLPDGVQAGDYARKLEAFARRNCGAAFQRAISHLGTAWNFRRDRLRAAIVADGESIRPFLKVADGDGVADRRRAIVELMFGAGCFFAGNRSLPFTREQMQSALIEVFDSHAQDSRRESPETEIVRYIKDHRSEFIDVRQGLFDLDDDAFRSARGFVRRRRDGRDEYCLTSERLGSIVSDAVDRTIAIENLAEKRLIVSESRGRIGGRRHDRERGIRIGRKDRVYPFREGILDL